MIDDKILHNSAIFIALLSTFPATSIRGPPAMSHLSVREVSAVGNNDLFILGTNFSPDSRVVFRQLSMEPGTDFGVLGGYEETKVLWQRDGQLDNGSFSEVGQGLVHWYRMQKSRGWTLKLIHTNLVVLLLATPSYSNPGSLSHFCTRCRSE